MFDRSVATLVQSWVYLATGSPEAEMIETDGAAITIWIARAPPNGLVGTSAVPKTEVGGLRLVALAEVSTGTPGVPGAEFATRSVGVAYEETAICTMTRAFADAGGAELDPYGAVVVAAVGFEHPGPSPADRGLASPALPIYVFQVASGITAIEEFLRFARPPALADRSGVLLRSDDQLGIRSGGWCRDQRDSAHDDCEVPVPSPGNHNGSPPWFI